MKRILREDRAFVVRAFLYEVFFYDNFLFARVDGKIFSMTSTLVQNLACQLLSNYTFHIKKISYVKLLVYMA